MKKLIFEHTMEILIRYIATFLEMIGVIIVTIGAVIAIFRLIKTKFDLYDSKIRIDFAKALTFSLEFKLASELLKTVVIRTWNEVLVLSSVVLLRVVMTLIINWEMENEERKDKLEKMMNERKERYKILEKNLKSSNEKVNATKRKI